MEKCKTYNEENLNNFKVMFFNRNVQHGKDINSNVIYRFNLIWINIPIFLTRPVDSKIHMEKN